MLYGAGRLVQDFYTFTNAAPTAEGMSIFFGPPEGPAVMSLQRVDDAKLTKNRMHLDVMTDDLGACIEEVVERGGVLVDGPNGAEALEGAEAGAVFRWAVMADPQGNEFCLTTPVPGT